MIRKRYLLGIEEMRELVFLYYFGVVGSKGVLKSLKKKKLIKKDGTLYSDGRKIASYLSSFSFRFGRMPLKAEFLVVGDIVAFRILKW